MNRHFLHPATLFFLLTLVVALLSWVGSIYGWSGVQSLLSAEGLRWQLRNVGDGFFSAPFFSDILLLAFGVGLCMHSGFLEAVRRVIFHGRKLSRKEKRSLLLSLTVGAVYILAVLCLGFRSMGDSTQYYRRVEEFTLVRRCQLSPFVGAGNNGDNLRIQYRFIPYG